MNHTRITDKAMIRWGGASNEPLNSSALVRARLRFSEEALEIVLIACQTAPLAQKSRYSSRQRKYGRNPTKIDLTSSAKADFQHNEM
jgi:hypothetical protein